MTEPRPSRRADGRGWGGRGDARPGGGALGGDPLGHPEGQDSTVPPSDFADDAFAGPAEAPWVRYERPPTGAGAERRARPPLPDLSAVLAVLEGLRSMVPNELSEQLNHLIREFLLTLRALIDWYLERLDGGPRSPEVEDIPID